MNNLSKIFLLLFFTQTFGSMYCKIYLASCSADKTIKIWDWKKQEEIITIAGHTGWVLSVAFSPDGTYLVSGSTDKTVKIWNWRKGGLIKTLIGHRGWTPFVIFSPDGKYLFSGSKNRIIKIWNTQTWKEVKVLKKDFGISSLAFSPKGTFLAAGFSGLINNPNENIIKIWKTEDIIHKANYKTIATLKGHANAVKSLDFSKDGRFLVSGSSDNTCKIWNTSNWALEKNIVWAKLAAFTYKIADMYYFASGSLDNTIEIWDIKNWGKITTLIGHTNDISSMAISLDGKYLGSGSADQTIKIWKTADFIEQEEQKVFKNLEGHTDYIFSVAFSPNVKKVAPQNIGKYYNFLS